MYCKLTLENIAVGNVISSTYTPLITHKTPLREVVIHSCLSFLKFIVSFISCFKQYLF